MIAFGDERLPHRFWSKVQVNDETGCWEWTAARTGPGYGAFRLADRVRSAHRLAYLTLVGPVPDETPHLDHLCRVRHCCNPAHLEPVTHVENHRHGRWASATHCTRGHSYAEFGWVNPRGHRMCRKCKVVRRAEYKNRAQQVAS